MTSFPIYGPYPFEASPTAVPKPPGCASSQGFRALIGRQGRDQVGESATGARVAPQGRDVGQRQQDESPFVHPGMGQKGWFGSFQDEVVEGDKVEVEHTRLVSYAPR